MTQRSWRQVPSSVLAAVGVALLLQIGWRAQQPRPLATALALPAAPAATVLKLVGLGDPLPVAHFAALYLQAFDNQPGVSIPYRDLDYFRVEAWLERILDLDPAGQYPLLMASQLYAQVPDPGKQRRMLEFVYRRFFEDPGRRWRWLAHAAIVAKHRLGDPSLALKYAQAIAAHSRNRNIPSWASQMPIFILEDMGEAESAQILLGGLLASGTLTDPTEIRFLTERLAQMQEKNVKKSP